jgi:ABC-type glycerol-3-phosphate transport system permease component
VLPGKVYAVFPLRGTKNKQLGSLLDSTKSGMTLAAFQGKLDTQWHFLLAMTVITLLPVVIVLGFLQKYVTTGIASTGLK